jgi:hypothetical protein
MQNMRVQWSRGEVRWLDKADRIYAPKFNRNLIVATALGR